MPSANPPEAPAGETSPARLRIDLHNRLLDLGEALDRLEDFLADAGATPALLYAARLVLEELATNTIKYGYDDADLHRIRVDFTLGPPAALQIEDDGHPFDPTADAPCVDTRAPLEARPIGGLGLHMVRTHTASLRYLRKDGINRVRAVFRE